MTKNASEMTAEQFENEAKALAFESAYGGHKHFTHVLDEDGGRMFLDVFLAASGRVVGRVGFKEGDMLFPTSEHVGGESVREALKLAFLKLGEFKFSREVAYLDEMAASKRAKGEL